MLMRLLSIETDHPDEVPTIDGAWEYIKQQVEW